MSRPRPRSALFLGLLFMSSLVAGCGGEPGSSGGNGLEKTKIKVTTPSMVNDAPLYLARARPFEQGG